MALTGMNLCDSSRDAQKLIYKKGSRYVLTMVTGMMMRFVGVVFIAGANGAVTYFMLKNYVPWYGLAVDWLNPVVVAVIIGLLIAGPFMSVFHIAAETLVVCMMVDERMDRPRSARPKIMEIFDQRDVRN